jgi:hypothetical protein
MRKLISACSVAVVVAAGAMVTPAAAMTKAELASAMAGNGLTTA